MLVVGVDLAQFHCEAGVSMGLNDTIQAWLPVTISKALTMMPIGAATARLMVNAPTMLVQKATV